MDLCFNGALVDLAKLGAIGGGMLDMKVFPDVLSVWKHCGHESRSQA